VHHVLSLLHHRVIPVLGESFFRASRVLPVPCEYFSRGCFNVPCLQSVIPSSSRPSGSLKLLGQAFPTSSSRPQSPTGHPNRRQSHPSAHAQAKAFTPSPAPCIPCTSPQCQTPESQADISHQLSDARTTCHGKPCSKPYSTQCRYLHGQCRYLCTVDPPSTAHPS
jgi:hypothetical protein